MGSGRCRRDGLSPVSFVLGAVVKAKEGVFYGDGAPRVIRDRLSPNETTR